MKYFLTLFTFYCLLLGYNTTFAEDISPPIINNDMHVLFNIHPSQCPSSWNGRVDPETMTIISGYGMDTGVSTVGVQSCIGCAFDSSSHDCVCKTCYSYFN